MVAITSKTERFTVEEYLKMDRAGVFDGRRVELVLGRIIKVNSQADPHMWAITKAATKFLRLFPIETHWVVVQGTLYLGKYGAPDPDLHVFDVPAGTGQAKRPLPFLVVEVSDSTYRKDAGIKVIQYASAGIADYWIINLATRRIEVYRQPARHVGATGGWGYEKVTYHAAGDSIALRSRPDVIIVVSDLLP